MGEVLPLFPDMEPSKPKIPEGLVASLDKLIERGRIDSGEACELLDSYLETKDDSVILNLEAELPVAPVVDINQLTLF